MTILGNVVDERFFRHRMRSTKLGFMAWFYATQ